MELPSGAVDFAAIDGGWGFRWHLADEIRDELTVDSDTGFGKPVSHYMASKKLNKPCSEIE